MPSYTRPPLRPGDMLSTDEAADYLGVSGTTVREWVQNGLLPGIRVGKFYRYDPADVAAFVRPAGDAR